MAKPRYRSAMNAKRALGRQIETAMKRLGWKATGAELARRYQERFEGGITEQSANAWLRGRREPKAAHVQALNELLGITLNFGAGASRRRRLSVQEQQSSYTPVQEDHDAWQAYLALSHLDRKLARELIHALARNR